MAKNQRPEVRCGAKTRSGAECKMRAGQGTDHLGFGRCKFHGGSSPNGVKHAEAEERAWERTLREEIDPSLSTLVQLRDQARSAGIRLAASKDLLDRAGVSLKDGQQDQVIEVRIKWPE